MATLKHINSKNADYGAAEQYLLFEHDEFTMKPVLDETGRLIPREDYRLSTLNCGGEDFAVACMRANLRYEKNQRREDVKSHHYIISFDPRDGPDNGLTVDRAQELGEKFCAEHFPGHQALVCTHPDGHNHSGNIHVHIVINSLRIEEVPFLPYMDRPADTKVGCKHRCTDAALRYFKSEVMEMCHREGLYQIDLLNGSKNRVTDREYWAQKKGQAALDKQNASMIAGGKLSQAATPYDLTVISDVSIDGDSDITDYLATCDVQMSDYAKNMEQISVYDADMTYADLFAGQDLNLWPIDEAVPQSRVSVISISDFNRALAMQGKGPVALNEGEYLLNCNYEGTYQYVIEALRTHSELSVGGVALQRASDEVLQETYVMTSVGNNDRGTLIVPDSVVTALPKDVNALLVQYKEETNPDEVLQKMIPIGLDETHGYRYSEKNMLYDMFYGINALVTFICCYVGLIFLLICAALLALKQLTETTDNIFRYGLLQKLGAKRQQINHTLFVQTGVFFTVPLVVAGLYSILLIGKGMEIVEEFMNIHIATNVWLTVILFLIVYGSYFIATYLSCKRMVTEQKEMEV